MFDSHQADSPHSFAVDQPDFQSRVIDASAERPILVDFWADWCAPCHQLAPHLNRVIDECNGRIALAKVEVDEGENMKLAGHFRLRGFPTVILFRDGEERGRFSGSRSSHQIREWLREHLDPDRDPGLAAEHAV
jgi:putative thioredoxin